MRDRQIGASNVNCAPAQPARPPRGDRRRSSSRFCAFDLEDAEVRDVALGSLSPIVVCFVEDDDPQWEAVADVLESIASGALRCLVAAPSRCRTAAPLLGYRGITELLLLARGRPTDRLSLTTPSSRILALADAGPAALLDHG
jgi:hypothetical protein